MAHTVQYPFAIGAGYDLPLGSLTYFENIQDADGRYLYPPTAYASFLPGAPAFRFDGPEYQRGRPSQELAWTGNGGNGRLSDSGAEIIRRDFFGGNWSGSLTVNTMTDEFGTFELWNCIGTIRKQPESGQNFGTFNRYAIKLTRMRPITP